MCSPKRLGSYSASFFVKYLTVSCKTTFGNGHTSEGQNSLNSSVCMVIASFLFQEMLCLLPTLGPYMGSVLLNRALKTKKHLDKIMFSYFINDIVYI